MFSSHVTLVFVFGSVQGGEVGLRGVQGSRDVTIEGRAFAGCVGRDQLLAGLITVLIKIVMLPGRSGLVRPRMLRGCSNGGIRAWLRYRAFVGGFSNVLSSKKESQTTTLGNWHVNCLGLVSGVGNRQGGSRLRMRNVERLRRVSQVSGVAGYDGSSESSSSSESESDSNFENENVVESTESSHVTVSSEFEEAWVLEEIEEKSVHLVGMNFFQGMEAISQASSDSFNFQYGYGNELWEAMEINSTVAVNIVDISSRETSPWIPIPAWSQAFSFGGSIDFSLESIGQSFDPHYEYHYSPMPIVSSPANPEAGIEARKVDMEVQQGTEREVQMMEGTQNGMTRTSGALGGQVEKGGTSGGPASNVKDSRDIPTGKECNVCGAGDYHTWACTRIRSQPDLNAYLICSSCEAHGHFVADFPMTSVIRAVPISPHLQREDRTVETLAILGTLVIELMGAK
ncbi:hypothetical protein IGI04_025631, partial [Brassica rapa subsp. trilocularis]